MAVFLEPLEDFPEEQDDADLGTILFGRFMCEDRHEYSCQTREMTVDYARLSSDHIPAIGERVVVYIDEIGRLEGRVEDISGRDFRLALTLPALKREKLAARLSWLKYRDVEGLPDKRFYTRYEPRDGNTTLILPDGRVSACQIIDISLSGAAVRTSVAPPIGTQVVLGKSRARVTRMLPDGIAVEFAELLDEHTLARYIR